MRFNNFRNIIILFLAIFLLSCSDILDREPDTDFYEEMIWTDINLAKAYLGDCYDYIGGHSEYGLGMREDLLASCTDELWCIHRPSNMTFLKGNLKSDVLGYFENSKYGGFLSWNLLYNNIQRINIFLGNIDKVTCKTTYEELLKQRLKGEAYFIRAYEYSQLLFGYGGCVLTKKPFTPDSDFSTFKRSSLKSTQDFILHDLDSAMSYLPKKDNIDQGRATQGAAAALKSRLLLFCASTLVNGSYNPTDSLVSFTDGTRADRLVAARDAAMEIINGQYGAYSLSGPINDPPSPLTIEDVMNYSDNYSSIFNQNGLWNNETIWGVQYLSKGGKINKANLWNGPWGYYGWGNNLPTESSVRSFEMDDGSPFQWDKYNPGDDFLRTATAEDLVNDPNKNPYNGREPRFYSCIFFHGAKWQTRPPDLMVYEPLGKIQTGHLYYTNGKVKLFGLDTRQSLLSPYSSSGNGYYLRKFMNINLQDQSQNNSDSWVEFRFAEVLLNYAEACIEIGGSSLQNGLDALNMVRNRAGLPDRITSSQDLAIEFVRHERSIEFFAEGHRWYDIRRWMIAESVIKNVLNMRVKEFENGNFEWRLDPFAICDLRSFNEINYWLPIPKTEIIRAPQLINNPGY